MTTVPNSDGLLLALDPSSSCTGWAVGYRYGNKAEVIRADRLRAASKGKTAIARIQWQTDALWEIIEGHQPTAAIIEITSGKVNIARHTGGGAGLGVYGMAVGALWQACRLHPDCGAVHTVTENEWTRGFRKKAARATRAVMIWPPYADVKDAGWDIADAICLLDWFAGRLAAAEAEALYANNRT